MLESAMGAFLDYLKAAKDILGGRYVENLDDLGKGAAETFDTGPFDSGPTFKQFILTFAYLQGLNAVNGGVLPENLAFANLGTLVEVRIADHPELIRNGRDLATRTIERFFQGSAPAKPI